MSWFYFHAGDWRETDQCPPAGPSVLVSRQGARLAVLLANDGQPVQALFYNSAELADFDTFLMIVEAWMACCATSRVASSPRVVPLALAPVGGCSLN